MAGFVNNFYVHGFVWIVPFSTRRPSARTEMEVPPALDDIVLACLAKSWVGQGVPLQKTSIE
jgi:hypothetical protein